MLAALKGNHSASALQRCCTSYLLLASRFPLLGVFIDVMTYVVEGNVITAEVALTGKYDRPI
eukprot:26352-Eustigmatos_ZCMA.PRE.1